jgi:hypothetical protein
MRKFATWFMVGSLALAACLGPALAKDALLFATEMEAHEHCPTDTAVWLNIPTGIYPFKGMRWYGNTNRGA